VRALWLCCIGRDSHHPPNLIPSLPLPSYAFVRFQRLLDRRISQFQHSEAKLEPLPKPSPLPINSHSRKVMGNGKADAYLGLRVLV
jgi:hypothetical protein